MAIVMISSSLKVGYRMPKSRTTDLKYRQVGVDGLPKGRRGKHHELMQHVLRELKVLSDGSAMAIPLSDAGIGLANLRSAVHRAANARGLKIKTLADKKSFYVWKASEAK
jgi:hypothetical protein